MRSKVLVLLLLLVAYSAGCGSKGGDGSIELKRIPVDSASDLISSYGVSTDREVTADGAGSVKIVAGTATTIRLYQFSGIEVENAFLIYQAKIRCEDFKGEAYLEMWCEVPGRGEFFSRGFEQAVSGTTDWTTVSTPFRFMQGQSLGLLKLNLVLSGRGTVWIDDIRLLKKPLQ